MMRIVNALGRICREPFHYLMLYLMRWEAHGLITFMSRQYIRFFPDRPEGYHHIGAVLHRTGWPSKSAAYWAEGHAAQKRRLAKLGIERDVRYLGRSWICSIGHLAYLDTLAKARQLGLAPGMRHVIVAPSEGPPAANPYYLNLWRPFFEIRSDATNLDPPLQLAEYFPAAIEIDGQWLFNCVAWQAMHDRWEAAGRKPLLSFPADQESRIRAELATLGLPKTAWFVSLHVREGSKNTRNAPIDDYVDAIKKITDAGGWVVRMGDRSMTPLPKMKNVVDYAQSEKKRDVYDVYFLAKPRFFLGTNSGPAFAAATFGTPLIVANWSPPGVMPRGKNIAGLCKAFYSTREKRYLREDETVVEPLAFAEDEGVLRQSGIEMHPNKPDEISAMVQRWLAQSA